MLKLVHQHQQNKKLHSIIKEARKYESDLDLTIENSPNHDLPATKQAKKVKGAAKTCGLNKLDERWSQTPLQGKYYLRCQQADGDQAATHQWLRSSGLNSETEGFLLTAQDQSLFTRNYQANIIKNGMDAKCRFCDNFTETVDHLIAGCPVLAPNEYKNRHD